MHLFVSLGSVLAIEDCVLNFSAILFQEDEFNITVFNSLNIRFGVYFILKLFAVMFVKIYKRYCLLTCLHRLEQLLSWTVQVKCYHL